MCGKSDDAGGGQCGAAAYNRGAGERRTPADIRFLDISFHRIV
jgi:hypothetical protein